MGIFNHPAEGERWRTLKHIWRHRMGEVAFCAGAAFLFFYYQKTEIYRYNSYLNRSAMFGGRTAELEKPELVGSSDNAPNFKFANEMKNYTKN